MSRPSFNILIATVGRPKLQRMLDSLSPQLHECDCVTIVFDGHSILPSFDISKFKCPVRQFCEPNALGFWGHGIRNKYAHILEWRDFVMHADDDDIYYPHAFDTLRSACTDYKRMYVAKMLTANGLVPNEPHLRYGNIGTPNGIIPFVLNTKGHWASKMGGDLLFYVKLFRISDRTGNPPVFLDTVIYSTRDNN